MVTITANSNASSERRRNAGTPMVSGVIERRWWPFAGFFD
jgi:hypothetical protein